MFIGIMPDGTIKIFDEQYILARFKERADFVLNALGNGIVMYLQDMTLRLNDGRAKEA